MTALRPVTNSITVGLPATVTHSYDTNGNLLNAGTRYFSYDDENQLIGVTVSNAWWGFRSIRFVGQKRD
jgi:hypothetical protein